MSSPDVSDPRKGMTEAPSLKRLNPDEDTLDFAHLRKSGIEHLQDLCGEIWTDYNLHDPGVTLLEQFCYGLSDLIYRSRFEVPDYLFDQHGQIDGPSHLLLEPESALPCAPLTPMDYRKLLLDALPRLRNVWVYPESESGGGLLNIHLQLADEIGDNSEEALNLVAAVDQLYHRNRNLCEDLGKITIAGHKDYSLSGSIEIRDGWDPSEVLAKLYFDCVTAISPLISQQPFSDLPDQELAHWFDGPSMRHGYIDDGVLDLSQGPNLSELTQMVIRINGVTQVVALNLIDDAGQLALSADGDPATHRLPRLLVPQAISDLHIRLHKFGQPLTISFVDFLESYNRLVFAAENRQRNLGSKDSVSPLPTGVPARFGDYSSVQTDLPPVYGIGHYGLADSAPKERKAESWQLRAYMLLFEQLMIDYQQGLAALPRLYSTDDTLEHSYFHRVLRSEDLPGIERLYPEGADVANHQLGQALSWTDDFVERRSRVLDFLLAMHGETFKKQNQRNYAGEIPGLTDTDYLLAKISYLRQIPYINARGMLAFDYRRPPSVDNVSALAQKIALILELPPERSVDSATEAVRARDLRYVSDHAFLRHIGLGRAYNLEEADRPVLLPNPVEPEGSVVLSRRLICPSLLQSGSELSRYRLLDDGYPGSPNSLFFDLGPKLGYCRLSRHENQQSAVIEGNRLSQFFGMLTSETNTFHLVEHLLLRRTEQAITPNFHSHQVSAVLPGWSPHCCSQEQRKLIERRIQQISPAHISIHVLWLDFHTMNLFERLYGEWLQLKRNHAGPDTDVDRVALLLTSLLESSMPRSGQHVRWL